MWTANRKDQMKRTIVKCAEQQDQGWGDWHYEAPPPQQQQGQGAFVDHADFDTLVGRVGGVEQALQGVIYNFDNLNTNFTAFMNLWGHNPPPHGGNNQ